jgi:hypothetical protein
MTLGCGVDEDPIRWTMTMPNLTTLTPPLMLKSPSLTVGRCRLNPVFASMELDFFRLRSLTQRLCVILCDLTMCYSIERALGIALESNR